MLELSCNRRGRLSVARLMVEHGPALRGPELRQFIAANWPGMIAGKIPDERGIHFPQMPLLPPVGG